MRFTLSSFAAIALVGAIATPVTAQKDPPPKKPDPEVKAALAQFKKAISDRKATRDNEAIGLVDNLLPKYATMHKKDQSDYRKALNDCLTNPRIRRKPAQKGLYVACSAALGQMGADGAKILAKAYDNKKFKKSTGEESWVSMRAVFVMDTGRTKDPKQIKFLLDRASRDPNDPIMAKAGKALGFFEDAPLKLRQDIVKKLVNKFGEVDGKARASLDPGDAQVKRSKQRLAAITEPWNETLQKLTRQNLRTPADWQKFWNKNKGKNWDK